VTFQFKADRLGRKQM